MVVVVKEIGPRNCTPHSTDAVSNAIAVTRSVKVTFVSGKGVGSNVDMRWARQCLC